MSFLAQKQGCVRGCSSESPGQGIGEAGVLAGARPVPSPDPAEAAADGAELSTCTDTPSSLLCHFNFP
jgi:hypothetical protein